MRHADDDVGAYRRGGGQGLASYGGDAQLVVEEWQVGPQEDRVYQVRQHLILLIDSVSILSLQNSISHLHSASIFVVVVLMAPPSYCREVAAEVVTFLPILWCLSWLDQQDWNRVSSYHMPARLQGGGALQLITGGPFNADDAAGGSSISACPVCFDFDRPLHILFLTLADPDPCCCICICCCCCCYRTCQDGQGRPVHQLLSRRDAIISQQPQKGGYVGGASHMRM